MLILHWYQVNIIIIDILSNKQIISSHIDKISISYQQL